MLPVLVGLMVLLGVPAAAAGDGAKPAAKPAAKGASK